MFIGTVTHVLAGTRQAKRREQQVSDTTKRELNSVWLCFPQFSSNHRGLLSYKHCPSCSEFVHIEEHNAIVSAKAMWHEVEMNRLSATIREKDKRIAELETALINIRRRARQCKDKHAADEMTFIESRANEALSGEGEDE